MYMQEVTEYNISVIFIDVNVIALGKIFLLHW